MIFLPFFYLCRDISVWNSKTKQRVGDRLAKIGVVFKFGTALFFQVSLSSTDKQQITNNFVFEKQNNQWLITDLDFYKKLGFDYVFGILKWVWIFGVPILLLLFVFWFWMLIDCAKREFDDKDLWIIMLIFLNFIASILYFFIVKRKNITCKPLEFKIYFKLIDNSYVYQ